MKSRQQQKLVEIAKRQKVAKAEETPIERQQAILDSFHNGPVREFRPPNRRNVQSHSFVSLNVKAPLELRNWINRIAKDKRIVGGARAFVSALIRQAMESPIITAGAIRLCELDDERQRLQWDDEQEQRRKAA